MRVGSVCLANPNIQSILPCVLSIDRSHSFFSLLSVVIELTASALNIAISGGYKPIFFS